MRLFPLLVGLALCLSSVAMGDSMKEQKAVGVVLDNLHKKASEADGKGYFALFAQDAIFFGTDLTERWTIAEFEDYAMPYFKKGKGWTYTPTQRAIFVSEDKKTAWFDEVLDNSSYGMCRGTGVLIQQKGEWKIAQYHLTIPIPNKLAKPVVAMIRKEQGKPE